MLFFGLRRFSVALIYAVFHTVLPIEQARKTKAAEKRRSPEFVITM